MNKHLIICFILFGLITAFSFRVKAAPVTYFPVVENGQVLPWKEVTELLPKGKKFKVIDVETGLYFYVQRRAGNKHADVQPLTRKDTAIMKHLYNNKWSWNRRAILVPVKGKLLAASMNGMPHGGGALNNGFPGHFCIHFAKSTTHRTNNVDPDHQMMVLKAGGKLEEYVKKANPSQLVHLFLVGVKQHDDDLIKHALNMENAEKKQVILKNIKDISTIHYDIASINTKEIKKSLIIKTKISLKVTIYWKDQRSEKTSMTFTVERASLIDSWRISDVKF
ncbi:hypothetical protein FZC66_10285 [Priestia megaterium]|nr:hypothetical protein FZC66_10285 [Priestia megaterium]